MHIDGGQVTGTGAALQDDDEVGHYRLPWLGTSTSQNTQANTYKLNTL